MVSQNAEGLPRMLLVVALPGTLSSLRRGRLAEDKPDFNNLSSESRRRSTFWVALVWSLLGFGLAAHAQQPRIIAFDASGAGNGAYQGTYVTSINALGVIGGFYRDTNYVSHGFLRSPDGKFVSFDVPGATEGAGTYVIAINDEGAAVGYWNDVSDAFHGFLRKPDGTIVNYTDPNECTGADYQGCQGTGFYAVNDLGQAAGAYLDMNYVNHGLVGNLGGKVTPYEAPGSGSTPDSTPTNYTYQGTDANITASINVLGAVTGEYVDSGYVSHGYVRGAFGSFIEFDAAGADATDAGHGTYPASINNFGEVTGDYLDANNVYHAFLRYRNGTFASFDAPGADTMAGSFSGTYPSTVNDLGLIVGTDQDSNNVYHGFVRNPNGTVIVFDAPGADQTPQDYNGTFTAGVNLEGAIAGYYVDVNYVSHGFIRVP